MFPFASATLAIRFASRVRKVVSAVSSWDMIKVPPNMLVVAGFAAYGGVNSDALEGFWLRPYRSASDGIV